MGAIDRIKHMMNRPTIRQLQYVLVLYETKNFRKAAEKCCVGQSAISLALQELESQWGVVLFERTNRKVTPSYACEQIINSVRDLLLKVDALVAKVQGTDCVFQQNQRLGVIHTIAPYFLPNALPVLKQKWPEMPLFLREGTTTSLLDELAHNKLDLLLMATPYSLGAQFESVELGKDCFWLAMHSGHRLTKKQVIAVNDIPHTNLLLLEDGHCLREHVKEACMLESSLANQAYNGTSLDTLMHMVAHGLGVTLVPHIAVMSSLLDRCSLVLRPLESNLPNRRIALVWRKTSIYASEYLQIAATLGKVLASMLAPSDTQPSTSAADTTQTPHGSTHASA